MLWWRRGAAGFTIGGLPADGWRQQPGRYVGRGAAFVNRHGTASITGIDGGDHAFALAAPDSDD